MNSGLNLTFVLALSVGGSAVKISTGNAALSAIDTGTTLIGSITILRWLENS
jgi:hypothetical protein